MNLSGAEFASWYRDPDVFADGIAHDGLTLKVDGTLYSDDVGGAQSPEPLPMDWLDALAHADDPASTLNPSAKVTVIAGDLVDGENGQPLTSVEQSIRSWRRSQKTAPTEESGERAKAALEALDKLIVSQDPEGRAKAFRQVRQYINEAQLDQGERA